MNIINTTMTNTIKIINSNIIKVTINGKSKLLAKTDTTGKLKSWIKYKGKIYA
jgi:hypothetical protein